MKEPFGHALIFDLRCNMPSFGHHFDPECLEELLPVDAKLLAEAFDCLPKALDFLDLGPVQGLWVQLFPVLDWIRLLHTAVRRIHLVRLLLATLVGVLLLAHWLLALEHADHGFGSRFDQVRLEIDLDILNVPDDWVEFLDLDTPEWLEDPQSLDDTLLFRDDVLRRCVMLLVAK